MKIVQGDEVEWKRGLEYRGGTFHYRNLMEGEAGTIGNFQLSMGRNDKDFVSPRHRHNFEQFRFQLEGDLEFGRDGTMKPGMVGYFPEGAHYGPQTSQMDALTIVLQFGGASGSGYLSRAEVTRGMQELSKTGTFEGGVYRRNEGAPGKKNMDGYQAIWEHVNGRPMEYPKPRYPMPLMMDETHFSWVSTRSEPGVDEKQLGQFTERRADAAIVRVAKGAKHTLRPQSIYFCKSGRGRIADAPVRYCTTVHVAAGDSAVIEASEDIIFLRMGLPDLSGLERQAVPASMAAE